MIGILTLFFPAILILFSIPAVASGNPEDVSGRIPLTDSLSETRTGSKRPVFGGGMTGIHLWGDADLFGYGANASIAVAVTEELMYRGSVGYMRLLAAQAPVEPSPVNPGAFRSWLVPLSLQVLFDPTTAADAERLSGLKLGMGGTFYFYEYRNGPIPAPVGMPFNDLRFDFALSASILGFVDVGDRTSLYAEVSSSVVLPRAPSRIGWLASAMVGAAIGL